ncbi:MAG: quinone-dependent dihydroorotate dehydrogenase [Ginsengibacter sp.]
MYRLLRNFLFLFDPEDVHYFSMDLLKIFCKSSFIKNLIQKKFKPAGNLRRNFFGLEFSNPVGLAAGFDKNAKYLEELAALGFGFVEIGTVTPLPQLGNPKPRLFRVLKDKALINRMGFNNDGVEKIVARLKEFRKNNKKKRSADNPPLVIGGNIGKNKNTPNEDAWKDYEISFNALHDLVDYFVVYVSSPNTPGLRALQQKDTLKKILSRLQELNKQRNIQRPLLLKISPDLSTSDLDDIIDLAMEINLDGLVATNTTISRDNLQTSATDIQAKGAGGLSGLPVKVISTNIIKYIFERSGGKVATIASGGIFSGYDAVEKFNSGACLVQVWTGFIYEGPSIVKNICKSLL